MSDEFDGITVSWSEIDTGRQCKYKHHLAYDQRYQRPNKPGSTLDKGTLWHEIIQVHYEVIQANQIMVDSRWKRAADETVIKGKCSGAVAAALGRMQARGVDPDTLENLLWMYTGYVEMYGTDDNHRVMGVETTHFVPLGHVITPGVYRQEQPIVPVRLKFKIDRTVQDKFMNVWVLDEKSVGKMPSDATYDFHDQFPLYVWGLRKLGINVRGAIHSAALRERNKGDIVKPGSPDWKSTMKWTPLDRRFKRTPIHYTDAQLRCVARDALDDVQALYGRENKRQRQPDNERCQWRCDFTEACLFGRRTGKPGDTVRMLELEGFTQNFERN